MKPLAALASALFLGACAAPQESLYNTPVLQREGVPNRTRASYEAPPLHVNRTSLLIGQRRLDQDVWEPLENQVAAGFEISRVNAHSGNGYEFGLLGSYDKELFSAVDIDAVLVELFAGFRVQRPQGTLRPFAGLGGAVTFANLDAGFGSNSVSDSGAAVGGYLHGGINLEIGRDLDLVLELRQRFGTDIEFEGTDFDIDYLTFLVGVSF